MKTPIHMHIRYICMKTPIHMHIRYICMKTPIDRRRGLEDAPWAAPRD